MKNTSKTMYRFGNLLQIIYLAIAALVALIALIIILVGLITGNEPLTSSGVSSLVSMIIWLVLIILGMVFVGRAQRELKNEGNKNFTPYILTIIFGAICGNVLYVLAGIFGIIAESKQGDQPKEEPQEEPAPEEEKPE